MAQAARNLRVVGEQPEPDRRGDPDLTRTALAGWKEGQRKCRARRRHSWGPYTVREHRTFYEVVERCGLCRNLRTADYSKQGRKLTAWHQTYRDGYLLPKGAARLDDEMHDELVLTDILSRRIIEVPDEDEDSDR